MAIFGSIAEKPQRAKKERASEPAGVGRDDRAGKDVARDRLVALELELADHELSLLCRPRNG